MRRRIAGCAPFVLRRGQYAEQALAADESDYEVRSAIGQYLLSQQRFGEAEPHLKWCASRRPDDKQMAANLEAAAKGRINAQTATAPLRTGAR